MTQAEMSDSAARGSAATGFAEYLSARTTYLRGLGIRSGVTMGYERLHPVAFRGGGKPIPPHHARLADYGEFITFSLEDEVEAEQCTWPEIEDQTQLARWCSRWDFDDAEDEDEDLCITDLPHDAMQEDGL